jgi:hypothetical protein
VVDLDALVRERVRRIALLVAAAHLERRRLDRGALLDGEVHRELAVVGATHLDDGRERGRRLALLDLVPSPPRT